MTITVNLLQAEEIVFAEGTPVEDVVSELREVGGQTSKHDKTGFAWRFPVRRSMDIFESVDELYVGIRGEVGTLLWSGESESCVPTSGEFSHWVEYFSPTGYETGVFRNADGVDLPLETVLDAVREFARTGQRPTCIAWIDADDVTEYPAPKTNTGEIYVTPGMDADDVLAKMTPEDRPRSWRLFLADDETDVRLRTDSPPMLWFGLDTEERGFLLWEDLGGRYMPAHGDDESSHSYFALGDTVTGIPARSMLPSDEVQQAIREAVSTRQRPTSVEWVERRS
ncbi:Imm1 family immunity protein [Saccharopolyspora sp. ID03-671]|uniref:Imm1 family immunity protein n=1 Tax=Saccharopolyspora sp. ID03-671 TaxID=3073066 RepID=UPI00324882A5